jgi:hypothetical protein
MLHRTRVRGRAFFETRLVIKVASKHPVAHLAIVASEQDMGVPNLISVNGRYNHCRLFHPAIPVREVEKVSVLTHRSVGIFGLKTEVIDRTIRERLQIECGDKLQPSARTIEKIHATYSFVKVATIE